jgi:hypothetical protein
MPYFKLLYIYIYIISYHIISYRVMSYAALLCSGGNAPNRLRNMIGSNPGGIIDYPQLPREFLSHSNHRTSNDTEIGIIYIHS